MKFGGLTHKTWPSVVTTWLQDGTFTTPPDQPYLGFWRHALERCMTACLLPCSGSVFLTILSVRGSRVHDGALRHTPG